MLFIHPPALQAPAPAPTPRQLALKDAAKDRSGRPYCIVATGETMTRIGVRFHTKPEALMAWNRMTTPAIEAGARVYLAPPSEPEAAHSAPEASAKPEGSALIVPTPPSVSPGLARAAAMADARPIHEDEGRPFPGSEAAPSTAVPLTPATAAPSLPHTNFARGPEVHPAPSLPTPSAYLLAPGASGTTPTSRPAVDEGFIQDPNGAVIMGAAVPPPSFQIQAMQLKQGLHRKAARGVPAPKVDLRSNPLSGLGITDSSLDYRESLPSSLPPVAPLAEVLKGLPIIDEARPRAQWDSTQQTITRWWEGQVFHTIGALKAVVWTSTEEGPCLDLELAASAQLSAVVIVRVPGNYLPALVDMTTARGWAGQGLTIEVAGNPAYLDGPGTADAIRARRLLSPWALIAQVARVRIGEGDWQSITLPAVSPQLPPKAVVAAAPEQPK